MNVKIAAFLKSKLQDALYVDMLSGLIRELSTSIENPTASTSGIKKTYPVSLDGLNEQTCKDVNYMKQLVPDASKRTIIYFEDGGIVFSEKEGAYMNFISTLSLVCWINTKKFVSTLGTVSSPIVMDIIDRMDFGFVNDPPVSKLKVIKISERPKSPSIFSRYSYNTLQSYLIYPYDYFCLNIETKFSLNKNCINSISLDESNCNPS